MHAKNHNALQLELPDEAATLALGAALATSLSPGLKVNLEGDLGAGKTTVVRGALQALGHAGSVKSPTYSLVELYVVSGLNLYHFDFYRFNTAEEFLDAGLDEYFDGRGICLAEWPDKAAPYLPAADLRIHLSMADAGRTAQVEALSDAGLRCLTNLRFRTAAAPRSRPPRPD
jgi:tRNA threonylcarbamoyladenosine biosynthesis protein TsaE